MYVCMYVCMYACVLLRIGRCRLVSSATTASLYVYICYRDNSDEGLLLQLLLLLLLL